MLLPLLTTLLLTQAAAQPITYTTVAKPCNQVLADLSKITHLKFGANQVAAREMVLVSVTQAPLKPLLTHIAEVTSCEWQRSAEGLRLVPDVAKREKEERDERASSMRNYRSQLLGKLAEVQDEERVKARELAAIKREGKESADQHRYREPSCEAKVLLRIALDIDPNAFSSIRPKDCISYATNNATSLQRNLSDHSKEALNDWVNEHNQRAVESQSSMDASFDANAYGNPAKGQLGNRMYNVRFPQKTIIELQGSEDYSCYISISAYDDLGRLILHTFERLPNRYYPGESNTPDNVNKQLDKYEISSVLKPSLHVRETPIIYSKWSSYVRDLQRRREAILLSGIDPELRGELTDEDGIDLLGMMPSDCLTCLATAYHRQIVADVPDSLLRFSSVNKVPFFDSVGEFLDACEEDQLVKFKFDDSFLVCQPNRPLESRSDRIDRASLKLLLSSIKSRFAFPSIDLSMFAILNPQIQRNHYVKCYQTLLTPTQTRPIYSSFTDCDWDTLRIFGLLDESERALLAAGSKVNIGDINPAARSYLVDFLFPSMSFGVNRSDVDDDFKTTPERDSEETEISYLQAEATEFLPQCDLSSVYITEKMVETPMLFLGDGANKTGWYLSPEDVDFTRYLSMRSYTSKELFSLPSSGKIGSNIEHFLTIHFPGKCRLTLHFPEPTLSPNAPTVSTSQLPQPFASLVEKARQDRLKRGPQTVS